MFQIEYYKNSRGEEPVKAYIDCLLAKTDKNSRVKARKIIDYINALALYGQSLGMPYMKHIGDEIWELRPLRDRIFFVAWTSDSFLILHHFMKQTQQTPRREINTAKRRLQETVERTNGKKNG
jgi:phage-related protein